MRNLKDASQDASSVATRIETLAVSARKKAHRERAQELADKHANGQLTLWHETERGVPNELVRCAIFSTKNRNMDRKSYLAAKPAFMPIIGGGYVLYSGEELRQDDERVWMQLIHLAKEARSPLVTFSPYSFIQSIKWPIKQDSYDRLLFSIRRLKSGNIEVYSKRFDKGMSTQLIRNYEYSKDKKAAWRVEVFDPNDGLLFLFDKLYSRLEWSTRLALPDGVATWLHGFFSSHKEAFDHKIETLANGAGLKLHDPDDDALPDAQKLAKTKERLRAAKKQILVGLSALKASGFLTDFAVSRTNLVTVRRVGDMRPIA